MVRNRRHSPRSAPDLARSACWSNVLIEHISESSTQHFLQLIAHTGPHTGPRGPDPRLIGRRGARGAGLRKPRRVGAEGAIASPQRVPDEGCRPLSVTGPARLSQGGHYDPGPQSIKKGGGGGQWGRGVGFGWRLSRLAELAGVCQCGPRRGCWDRRAPRKGSGPADVPEMLLPCLRCACRAGRCWQLRLPGPSDVPLRRSVHFAAKFAPLQTLGTSRAAQPLSGRAALGLP